MEIPWSRQSSPSLVDGSGNQARIQRVIPDVRVEREGEGGVTQTVNHLNESSGSKEHGPAIKLPGKQA